METPPRNDMYITGVQLAIELSADATGGSPTKRSWNTEEAVGILEEVQVQTISKR